MADSDRLEARGPRGEACIIVRTWDRTHEGSDERGSPVYRLATGERLVATDPENPSTFETLDGSRRFTLR